MSCINKYLLNIDIFVALERNKLLDLFLVCRCKCELSGITTFSSQGWVSAGKNLFLQDMEFLTGLNQLKLV